MTETVSVHDQPASATRLEFELLISDLSARFVNLPPDQVDREIEDALGKVRAFLGADQCGLFRFSQVSGEFQLSHNSYADGVSPVPMRADYKRLFPWGVDRLFRQAEALNQHTRDYPPEAAVDRASAEAMGVKSFLSVPLLSEGPVRYGIASNTVREETVWPEEYIPRLQLVGEIFVNAMERKRADEVLRQALEFEVLISDLSARFVNIPPGQVDREIVDALGKVRAFFHVDRCVLLKVKQEVGEVYPTHISKGDGIQSIPGKIDYVALYPWSTERTIRRGEVLYQITRDFPPEAAVDRASAESMGVKSFLTIPFLSGGAVRHLIHISIMREGRVFPDEYTTRLQLVGEILINALERKRSDEMLRQTLEFEMLISALSSRFVNIPADPVDLEIVDALGKIRVFFCVDRCVIQKVIPEIGEIHVTHASVGDGMPPVPARIDYARLFPWTTNRLLRDAEIVHLHTRDYPPEAAVDRANAEAMGIKTSLRIPLLTEGVVRHVIVLSNVREEKDWPEEYLPRLRIVGEIILNALERDRSYGMLRKAMEEVQELRDRLQSENVYLREQLGREDGQAHIVGESDAILEMLAQARRVAPTDSTVLITGETGTGKELLAQAIHDMSGRSGKAMVIVNCAALPPALIESELFGREKGAFTGATTRQVGRIEVADGSTLFLDEIGDLPSELQVKLLRVLQDGRYERLGSNRTLTADVRVIAATHHDLVAMVRGGRFREDLYHRLNVYPIEVPPLRSRVSDIPLLVWRFVQEFNRKMGKSVDSISSQTMERLKRYPWPGNVRELRNLVERAMIGCDGFTLTIDLPAGAPSGGGSVPVTLEETERKYIRDVLERVNWRIRGRQGAAEILGLRPNTLHSRMKKLGISRPKP